MLTLEFPELHCGNPNGQWLLRCAGSGFTVTASLARRVRRSRDRLQTQPRHCGYYPPRRCGAVRVSDSQRSCTAHNCSLPVGFSVEPASTCSQFSWFSRYSRHFSKFQGKGILFLALSEPCTLSSEMHTYTGWIQPLGTWRFSQVCAGTSESQASPLYGWESTDPGLYFNGFQVTCFSKPTHFLLESATPIFKHRKQSPCTDLAIWIPPWSLIFLFFSHRIF